MIERSLKRYSPRSAAPSFVNTRNAGDGRRCKNAGALLLQVTTNLPNSAEYEADRHRDSDFKTHQEHKNHRRVPWAAQKGPGRFSGGTGGTGAWAAVACVRALKTRQRNNGDSVSERLSGLIVGVGAWN